MSSSVSRSNDAELSEDQTMRNLSDLVAMTDPDDRPVSAAGPSDSDDHASPRESDATTWLSNTRSAQRHRQGPNKTSTFTYPGPLRLANTRAAFSSTFDQSSSSPAPLTAGVSVFPNPNRSFFTSGQPTSSISVNTAQASMSPPPAARESRPLAALTGSTSTLTRRPAPISFQPPLSPTPFFIRNDASAEKDADDPNVAMDESTHGRRLPKTSTTLSQLFVEDIGSSGPVSRHGSYLRTLSGTQFSKARSLESIGLGPHVYGQGLLSGKFSDITVQAFGTSYSLHRLLLDRAPFFSTAFSGPWLEADTKEMKLDPADVDTNITQAAFELALKRLYGCEDAAEEAQEAIGLFAVACWLEMDDLLEASIENLLQQMSPAKLSMYIRFVTSNYYGKAGNRILSSAKAMLCRDGWRMRLRYWDGIPAEIIQEIIAGDGLFISGEWDRWVLAKRLLNRRLRALAQDAGMINEDGNIKLLDKMFRTAAPRYQKANVIDLNSSRPWQAFYVDQEIVPLLQLIDSGIHYVHLSFEELQHIRNEGDIFGLPILPEKVVLSAIWMQMEIRQKIINADECALDLGLLERNDNNRSVAPDLDKPTGEFIRHQRLHVIGIEPGLPDQEEEEEDEAAIDSELPTNIEGMPLESQESSAVLHNGGISSSPSDDKAQRFWVPTIDATFPVGEIIDRRGTRSSQASRGSRNSLGQADDVRWTGDLSSLTAAANEDLGSSSNVRIRVNRSPATPKVATSPGPQIAFTKLPPFRFSVEFPPADMLKENKRLYSNTIWYAGSLWNVYIQKKDSAKGMQLGVYLHREKQSENAEIMLANYVAGHSVDERIDRLEREIHSRRRVETRLMRDDDVDMTPNDIGTDLDALRGSLSRPSRRPHHLTPLPKAGSYVAPSLPQFSQLYETELDEEGGNDSDVDSDDANPFVFNSMLSSSKSRRRQPTLPPYNDGRPTIKTFFKIFTPSKDGRVLTVYESKPDRFNFSQSWGWKSSLSELEGTGRTAGANMAKEKRLRFMFVLGIV